MKQISGYENYVISENGEITNANSGLILKPYLNKRLGYMYITLTKKGIQKDFRIHRLVAQHFIPNPSNFPEVNHINGIKSDNRVENLEWCDRKMNAKHAWGNGLMEKNRARMSELGKRRVKEQAKPVLQYNFSTGEFIKEYPSTKQAARETGIHQRDISNVANSKHKYVKNNVFIFKGDLNQ